MVPSHLAVKGEGADAGGFGRDDFFGDEKCWNDSSLVGSENYRSKDWNQRVKRS